MEENKPTYVVYRKAVGGGIPETIYAGQEVDLAKDAIPPLKGRGKEIKPGILGTKYYYYWAERWENGKVEGVSDQCDMYGHDMYIDKEYPDKSCCNYCGTAAEEQKELS